MAYPTVSVIIPAFNEAANLALLLPELQRFGLGQVILVDNNSTDDTAQVGAAAAVEVVRERQQGYGAACSAGVAALASDCKVVCFLDADLQDDPGCLPQVVGPVLEGTVDLVIGTRPAALQEKGAMTPQQLFGNWLATTLIRLGWNYRFTDLGPFRAITRDALERIDMRDRRYGWTVEMQIRAVEQNLRIQQVALPYRCRREGHSTISGTLRGTLLAGYWILRTVGGFWLARISRRPKP